MTTPSHPTVIHSKSCDCPCCDMVTYDRWIRMDWRGYGLDGMARHMHLYPFGGESMTICGATGLPCRFCNVPCLPPPEGEPRDITLSSRQMIYEVTDSSIKRLGRYADDVYPLGMSVSHQPTREISLTLAMIRMGDRYESSARMYLDQCRANTSFDVK